MKFARGQRSIFHALTRRNFSLEMSGRFVSFLGNGMYTITLAWTAYQLSRSGSLMAEVLVANDVPQIALMLFGGVLGDRYSRRIVIMASDGAACIVTALLALAAVQRDLRPLELIAGSFILGIATATFMPAYSAINSELVPTGDIGGANALRNSATYLSRIAGPAIGGIVYAAGGAGLGFGLDAASFAVAICAMWLVKLPAKIAVPEETKIIKEVVGGFRIVWRTGWLRTLILIALVENTFCIAPILVLLPLIVKDAGHSASFLGLALAGESAITAIFSLVVGKLDERVRPGFMIYSLTVIMGLGACVVGIFSNRGVAILIGIGLVGVGFASGVIEDNLIQRNVPPEYLSRVYGLGTTAAYALLPVGYLIAGFLSRGIGPGPVVAAGGAMLVVSTMAGLSTRTTRELDYVPAADGVAPAK